MQKNEDYFDKLGDKFDEFMSDYDVERRQALIFSVLLNRHSFDGMHALEVGCGTGRFSQPIRELAGKLTVLDIGRRLVKKVSKRLCCSGTVADACSLPFRDRTFDVIVSSECIEHTEAPEQAIREMCRVCRPGGLVCITSPNKLWYPILVISRKLGLRKFAGNEHWLFPGHAAAVMCGAGMTDLVISGCHMWPFQLKFTRPLLRVLDRWGKYLYPLMINFGLLARRTP